MKNKNIIIGIGLSLVFLKSQSQTPGPLEVTSSNSGSTILVGRKDGNPSIKSSQQSSGHLILDSEFNKYVSLNHYTPDDVVLAFGGGNVGLGKSDPKSKFHVYKGASGGNPHDFSSLTVESSNHSMISILTPDTKTAYFGFADSKDDYVGGMQYDHSSDKLVFRTNNHSSDLVINNNGNVGIGTTKPDMKLTVKGKIHAEEVKIDLSVPAPDYVFKEDYNLRSIEEVEKFIKANSHLPEILSAKEFEEKGVMQAEMDMNLLKKIEELTLYTIGQEKKIKNLERKNEELNSINKKLIELQSRLEKLESKK